MHGRGWFKPRHLWTFWSSIILFAKFWSCGLSVIFSNVSAGCFCLQVLSLSYLYSSSKQHCFKDCHPLKCTGVFLTIIFSHFWLHLYVLIHKMMGSPNIFKYISHNSCSINTQYPPCDHSSFKISYFSANKLWYLLQLKIAAMRNMSSFICLTLWMTKQRLN